MILQDTQKEKNNPIKRGSVFVSILLIVILGFVSYSNSINGKFILDDNSLVKNNVYIKSRTYLAKKLINDLRAGSVKDYYNYRPLIQITYAIDYSLWGLNVRGYHLSNILLHALVAIAIYWLINILFQNNLLSLLTSLFFVVHPIHTEAVSYISGRADSLVGLFMLLCIIFYIKQLDKRNIGIYILMLASCILATLSKENSLILPALLLLYHYVFRKKVKLSAFMPVLTIAIAYIISRLVFVKSAPLDISSTNTAFQRIPGFFVAITNYIRLLFLPFNLHFDYGRGLFSLTDPKAILGVALSVSLLLYALKTRKSNKLIFLSIAWFFLALLPVSNIYPVFSYMAEHFLYLPSIGFFLLFAKGITYSSQKKRLKVLIAVLTVSLLSFYSYLTIKQSEYWKEPIPFYKWTLRYAPDSALMHGNLAREYIAVNRKQEAIASYEKTISLYKKTIERNPYFVQAYNQLGVIYYNLNQQEEAIASYKKAMEINPYYTDAYNNLGLLYNSVNKHQEAITAYKKAIEIDPDLAVTYNNLGLAYEAINNQQEALASYTKAIELNPDFAGAYNNLGVIYYNLNQQGEAIASYKKAIEINPNYAQAHNNLGLAYEAINNQAEAIASYKKAIEIDPNHANAYNNLSIIYFHQKQYELAIEFSDKARELGFDNPALLETLKPYKVTD